MNTEHPPLTYRERKMLEAVKALMSAIKDHRMQIGDRIRLPNDTVNHASYALLLGDMVVTEAEGLTTR